MDLIPVTRPAPHPLAQRIGDSERSAACDELSTHFAAGRLTDEELDGRLAATMVARTTHELLLVLGDLPRTSAPTPARSPAGPPAGGASALEVLCVVAIVLGTLFAGGMLLVLGAYEFGFFLAALAGGTATAMVGGSIVHLAHRQHDRNRSLRPHGR